MYPLSVVLIAFTVGLCVGVLSCAAVVWAALTMAERLMNSNREEPLP